MTLSGIAEIVTEKVGHTDSDSVAVCKKFIRRRYEMIWNESLWKESLGVFVQSDYTTKILGENTAAAPIFDEIVLNSTIDRPIAIRYVSDSRKQVLENTDLAATLFSDPDRFSRIGDPVSFTILGSQASGHYRDAITVLEIFSSSVSDVGGEVYIAEYGNGYKRSETVVLNGTSSVSTTNTYNNPTVITKPTTMGAVTVQIPVDTRFTGVDVLMPELVYLQPGERERRHVKVKIQGQPRETFTLVVIGKRRFPDLDNDNDTTPISGVDNALISYAQADMLERERQYGKAQLKIQEGGALLAQLKRLETHQQANISRIVPVSDGGYDTNPKLSIFS